MVAFGSEDLKRSCKHSEFYIATYEGAEQKPRLKAVILSTAVVSEERNVQLPDIIL